ncbi:MAG: DMT family transporter [Thermoplasmatales archaeon]|nr:DMT family transporter [Thermoplasmatales archaeon]
MPEQNKNKKENSAKKYFYLIMGLPIIFWALAFPFIKIGLEELSPINLTIIRLFIACFVFLILLCTMPKKFSKLHKKDIIPLFLLGFLGVVVYHLGLNYGEQHISASAASLIIATIPIFIVILAILFLKEKITLKIIFGVALSLIGVVIVSIVGTPDSSVEITYLSCALAVLIAALMGAGYTIAGKKMLKRYSALSLTTYAFLIGSLGLIPFINTSFFEELAAMSITGWSAVLFLGIFSTVIGYVLWYVALEIKTASEISVYLYFIPVLSTSISYFFFDEQITWLFILGGTLVILGLYITNKNRVRKL